MAQGRFRDANVTNSGTIDDRFNRAHAAHFAEIMQGTGYCLTGFRYKGELSARGQEAAGRSKAGTECTDAGSYFSSLSLRCLDGCVRRSIFG